MVHTLIVPGLNGSGPDHWQSWWLALEPDAVWVEQENWAQADLGRWAGKVEAALDAAAHPVWIVAHSFGVLASVQAASRRPDKVVGAFFVAPADPHKFQLSGRLYGQPLPFPSLVVASSNDPWMKLMHAAYWADRWGSHLFNLGNAGHINPESGFGPWIEGRTLFQKFVRSHDGIFSGEIPLSGASAGPDFLLSSALHLSL
ncbi:MAG: alpha/beta hydrolase [Rhodocyclaceae bacterium]|nr:MAG: alpha/beta hydrolase [Rhodocyclaceae bacterium]